MEGDRDPNEPLDVKLPARITVRCRSCGHVRRTLSLHDDALRRARTCVKCQSDTDVVESTPVHGLGCPCCS